MAKQRRSARNSSARRQANTAAARESASFARHWRWLVPAMVMVVTFVVFRSALAGDFVNWDDDHNFLSNSFYRGLGAENLRWMFTTFHLGPYQPLSWLTLGLDYAIWGMDPFGYHLTNVILHVINAGLMYALTLQLIGAVDRLEPGPPSVAAGRVAAGVAALVFALHPLRVESVAWVTERRDVLSGFFFLLTVLAYVRAAVLIDPAGIR